MHIHIPDGILPAWLWISGIILLLPMLGLAVHFVGKDTKKLVSASAIAALMLIVFSVEVFGYHLNFTALSGIILGPWWSLLSIAVVNFFLALFGHGGITVAPLNIILNWVEALTGFIFFRTFLSRIKNSRLKSALSSATVFFALTLSFIMFLGIIRLANINPGLQLEGGAQPGYIPINEFIVISAIPMLIGGIIESVLTFFILQFIIKVKPGIIR